MIECTLKDQIYEISFSTPPCNEIGSFFVKRLSEVIDSIDPSKANALIFYSTQKSGFCAGADLIELYRGIKEFDKREAEEKLSDFIQQIHNLFNKIDLLPLVTIGVIHGICFGGGFELALCLDLLIGEKNARFCFPELRLGIIPGFGGMARLKRACSPNILQDLVFTGRSINAKKAFEINLLSQLVENNEGLNVARSTAHHLNRFPHHALINAKKCAKKIPFDELEEEKKIFLKLCKNPILLESLEKFVIEKNPISYQP